MDWISLRGERGQVVGVVRCERVGPLGVHRVGRISVVSHARTGWQVGAVDGPPVLVHLVAAYLAADLDWSRVPHSPEAALVWARQHAAAVTAIVDAAIASYRTVTGLDAQHRDGVVVAC